MDSVLEASLSTEYTLFSPSSVTRLKSGMLQMSAYVVPAVSGIITDAELDGSLVLKSVVYVSVTVK